MQVLQRISSRGPFDQGLGLASEELAGQPIFPHDTQIVAIRPRIELSQLGPGLAQRLVGRVRVTQLMMRHRQEEIPFHAEVTVGVSVETFLNPPDCRSKLALTVGQDAPGDLPTSSHAG
jgi:hypothetical protein